MKITKFPWKKNEIALEICGISNAYQLGLFYSITYSQVGQLELEKKVNIFHKGTGIFLMWEEDERR